MNRVDDSVRRYDIAEYGNIENSVDYFLRFRVGKDRRILDVGTNLGTFPYELHRRGYTQVYGIDVREDAIQYGRQQYGAIRESLLRYDGDKLPFNSDSFDVVTMFDVIEHIPHVDEFLLDVNRVLVRGGRLIFQTPNKYINSVWSTIVWRSMKWKEEHCSLQSLSSLRKLLRAAGFHEIVIDKFSIDTAFNRRHVSKQLGPAGLVLLNLSGRLPLNLFPNFYGSAVK